MHKIAFVLAGSILLHGCARSTQPAPPPPPPSQCPMEKSGPSGSGFPVLEIPSTSVQPGDTAFMRLGIRQGPAVFDAKVSCISDLSATPAGPTFEFGEYGRLAVTIPEDAASGTVYAIRGRYGSREFGQDLLVYRRSEQPLVGIWHQRKEDCQGSIPLKELDFRADGSMSATWEPFETYKDYWGRYAFDRQSGQLQLELVGGNMKPGDMASGSINLTGDSFTLVSASFGSYGGRGCSAPFYR